MKIHFTLLLIMILVGLASPSIFAQTAAIDHSTAWVQERKSNQSIIINKGQFEQRNKDDTWGAVQFAYDGENENVFFTNRGIIIELTRKLKRKKSAEEKRQRNAKKKVGFASQEEFRAFENVGHRLQIDEDDLQIKFLGANPNPKLITEEQESHYHSYSYYDEGNRRFRYDRVLFVPVGVSPERTPILNEGSLI